MPLTLFSNRRLNACAWHLLASLLLALAASALVFGVWYPSPYAQVAGGTALFFILISVDVVMGPALTAVAASPTKPLAAFRRDLAVIVVLQLVALGYGLYSMALARPVHLVFEIDRFRVVVAADIEPAALAEAPAALRTLPWFGPGLIAAVKPTDPNEQLKSIDLGMSGIDLSMVPRNWRDYASQAPAAWAHAKPVSALRDRRPALTPELQALAGRAGQPVEALRYLPLVSRHAIWATVLAEPGARVIGHLAVDGFD
jgi:hypothetical protein